MYLSIILCRHCNVHGFARLTKSEPKVFAEYLQFARTTTRKRGLGLLDRPNLWVNSCAFELNVT